MIHTYESNKSVLEIVKKIQEVVPTYKFGVQHIHNVKENLAKKDVEFKEECQIVDICSPTLAKQMLEVNMSLSVIMPCSISVYTKDNQTFVAMNSLTQLVDDIEPELIFLAKKIQKTLLEIIEAVI